jgi:hypothetical protein
MSLVTGSSSLSPYASSASTAGGTASTKSTAPLSGTPAASGTDSSDKASAPADSTTVTLSTQGLNMSHASVPTPAAVPPAAGAASTTATPADAPASPSIYDDVKNGIAGAVDDVGAAIGGTARWIGDGVVDVVSGVDALVHGAVDLPFAIGAEACNAVGAVLDAI